MSKFSKFVQTIKKTGTTSLHGVVMTTMLVMLPATAILTSNVPAGAPGQTFGAPGVHSTVSPHTRTFSSSNLTASSNSPVNEINWSGYVATGQTFTKAQGEFTVPTITCTVGGAQTLFWVGFDGYTNGTVEQAGVGALCPMGNNPTPLYYAWWEMWPTYSIQVMPISVAPGNTVQANVSYAKGYFKLNVSNLTKPQQYTKKIKCASGLTCSRQSAEWIGERPTVNGTYTALADWNTSLFFNDMAAGKNSLQPISAFSNTPINMVNSTSAYLATVNPLQPDGKSFNDTWQAAQ